MSNSSGSSHESRTLIYYERLPKSVREAVRECRYDWALRPWLKMFEDGRINTKDLVKRIKKVDRDAAIKSARKLYGPDYPIECI